MNTFVLNDREVVIKNKLTGEYDEGLCQKVLRVLVRDNRILKEERRSNF